MYVPTDIVTSGILPARAWRDEAGLWAVLLSEAVADLIGGDTIHHPTTNLQENPDA